MPVAETAKNVNYNGNNARKRIDEEMLRALVAEGKTDGEIADVAGVTRRGVIKARQRLGLAPNAGRGRPASSAPRRQQRDIPKSLRQRAMRMINRGYAPQKVANRLGLRRSDVLQLLRENTEKTWHSLYEALSPDDKAQFTSWCVVIDDARAALPGGGNTRANRIPFELQVIRECIKDVRSAMNSLPWYERFPLHPEVLVRLGMPNAYMVALGMDASAVSLSNLISLLTSQLFHKTWDNIEEATAALSPSAHECALAYLGEEVREPYFGDELPDMVRAARADETEGCRLLPVDVLWAEDRVVSDEIAQMVVDEAQEKGQVCKIVAQRRGKGGGKRRRRVSVL